MSSTTDLPISMIRRSQRAVCFRPSGREKAFEGGRTYSAFTLDCQAHSVWRVMRTALQRRDFPCIRGRRTSIQRALYQRTPCAPYRDEAACRGRARFGTPRAECQRDVANFDRRRRVSIRSVRPPFSRPGTDLISAIIPLCVSYKSLRSEMRFPWADTITRNASAAVEEHTPPCFAKIVSPLARRSIGSKDPATPHQIAQSPKGRRRYSRRDKPSWQTELPCWVKRPCPRPSNPPASSLVARVSAGCDPRARFRGSNRS